MITNLFLSDDKRRLFDLISADIDSPISEDRANEIALILTTDETACYVGAVICWANLYRPCLMQKHLNLFVLNPAFPDIMNKVTKNGFSDLMLQLVASIGAEAACNQFTEWVSRGVDITRSLEIMLKQIIAETDSPFLMLLSLAKTSGLLELAGINDVDLLNFSYAHRNKMAALLLESMGVNIPVIEGHAEWFTCFGDELKNQMAFLKNMPKFDLYSSEIPLLVKNYGPKSYFSLKPESRACFTAMCAADYFRLSFGINPAYFLDDESELPTVIPVIFNGAKIELSKAGVHLVSDVSVNGFELFAKYLFVEFLLKEKFRFNLNLKNIDTKDVRKELMYENGVGDIALLLTSVLNTLSDTYCTEETMEELTGLLRLLSEIFGYNEIISEETLIEIPDLAYFENLLSEKNAGAH